MSLPNWKSDGLLPAGRHRADLHEFHERCVEGARNRAHREALFTAVRVFHQAAKATVGDGTLWIGGRIVTNHNDTPCDASILILPSDWNRLLDLNDQDRSQLYSLCTLQEVVVGSPLYAGLPSIRPVASMLDGFLCYPGQEDWWHDTWATVKGFDGQKIDGIEKGFVEVAL